MSCVAIVSLKVACCCSMFCQDRRPAAIYSTAVSIFLVILVELTKTVQIQCFAKIVDQPPMFCQCFQYFSMFFNVVNVLSRLSTSCGQFWRKWWRCAVAAPRLTWESFRKWPSARFLQTHFNSYDKSHFSLALFYQSHFQFNSNVSKWDFQLLWNGQSPSGPPPIMDQSVSKLISFPSTSVFSTSET